MQRDPCLQLDYLIMSWGHLHTPVTRRASSGQT